MNWIASFLPYAAVLVGMYCFHSAWWAIGLYHIGIAGYVLWRKPPDLRRRILSGYPLVVLLPGIAVCALAAPVIYFMWPWFATGDGVLPEWMGRYGLTGRAWLLLIPYFSIVHPVLEEIHWRAIAPDRFRVLCLPDFLFAGYHVLVLFQLIRWPWLFLVFGVLTASSIFWRWTADRFGGYGVAILTHAVADAGVLIGVAFLL